MKRKIFLQLMVPLLSLCVLFLLLATEPASGSGQQELVELSVIFREENPVWNTTRAGMEQAAADMGAELRFLAPSAPNDADEQQELLTRELEAGAKGVILLPTDRKAVSELVHKADSVIVTLETDLSDMGADAYIGMDNRAAGTALGKAVLNGVPPGQLVVLLDTFPGDNGVRQRMDAARAVLEEEGRKVQFCCVGDGEDLSGSLALQIRYTWPAAVVAFEASALETASETVREMRNHALYKNREMPLLYGVGNTPAIAAGLEQSRILAVQAQDDFSAGYLAVVTAMNTMRFHVTPSPEMLPCTLVRKENMYNIDLQKLLFPVTR